MRAALVATAIVGIIVGAGLSLMTRSSDHKTPAADRVVVDGGGGDSSNNNPLDRAYFYPDPPEVQEAVVKTCAGQAPPSVPGTPELTAIPKGRAQSLAVIEQGYRNSRPWFVEFSSPADDWSPVDVRQVGISSAHLGYVACVAKTPTFEGQCGNEIQTKLSLKVTVREAHTGAEVGTFEMAPADPKGCSADPNDPHREVTWADYGPRVVEMIHR